MQFFETVMGKQFFEGKVPKLIKALERIADALEKEQEPAIEEEKDVISEKPLTVRQLLFKVPSAQEITIISNESVIYKGYSRALSDDLQLYWNVQVRNVKSVVTHNDEEDVLFIYLEEEERQSM